MENDYASSLCKESIPGYHGSRKSQLDKRSRRQKKVQFFWLSEISYNKLRVNLFPACFPPFCFTSVPNISQWQFGWHPFGVLHVQKNRFQAFLDSIHSKTDKHTHNNIWCFTAVESTLAHLVLCHIWRASIWIKAFTSRIYSLKCFPILLLMRSQMFS